MEIEVSKKMKDHPLVVETDLVTLKVLEIKLKTFKQIRPTFELFLDWTEWEPLGQVLNIDGKGRNDDWVVIRSNKTNHLKKIQHQAFLNHVVTFEQNVMESKRTRTQIEREALEGLPQLFAV